MSREVISSMKARNYVKFREGDQVVQPKRQFLWAEDKEGVKNGASRDETVLLLEYLWVAFERPTIASKRLFVTEVVSDCPHRRG